MVIPSPSLSLASLLCAFTGGFSGSGLWELLGKHLLEEPAEEPASSTKPECSCECDCSRASTFPIPLNVGISYQAREDSFCTGMFSALLFFAVLAAGFQSILWANGSRRQSRKVRSNSGDELVLAVTDGGGRDRGSSAAGSPPRSRRRGGGSLVKSPARP